MTHRCLWCVEREAEGGYPACLDCARANRRERDIARDNRTRQLVLDHYGHECACCGSTEDLTIDHINGGGRAHRASLGLSLSYDKSGRWGWSHSAGVRNFWSWLVKAGFPEGFQVLCGRCNESKLDGPACRLHHLRRAA